MYVTPDEVKLSLDQLADTHDVDAALLTFIAAAETFIDGEIGYSFGTSTATTTTVYGDGTPYLTLPFFSAGSVTAVSAPDGYTIPDYVERDGLLVVTDETGILAYPAYPSIGGYLVPHVYTTNVWLPGVPYTVSATFGAGDVPADVQQAVVQMVVRMWRFRDAGGADVVGVEGAGVVEVKAAVTPFVRDVINRYRKDAPTTGGIW